MMDSPSSDDLPSCESDSQGSSSPDEQYDIFSKMFVPRIATNVKVQLRVPGVDQDLPHVFDEICVSLASWASELDVDTSWFVERVEKYRQLLAAGEYGLHSMKKAPLYAVLLPLSLLPDLRRADETHQKCSWNLRSSHKQTSVLRYACSVSRCSRALDPLNPKKRARVLPHRRVGDEVVPQFPCPFICRVYKQSLACDSTIGLALVCVDAEHSHDDMLFPEMYGQMDRQVLEYVISQGRAGVCLPTIVKNLQASYILEFDRLGLKPNLKDKRIFPTYHTIAEIYRRHAREHLKLSSSDIEDVALLAQQNPSLVRVFQEYSVNESGISQHLGVHVGSSSTRAAYERFGIDGLVLLDATHKFNAAGYRTFTLMVVVFGANGAVREARVCGHLITSDLKHCTLETWLRKEFACLGHPKEIIIDVDSTEKLALENVFPSSHIAFCYFHCLKAILDNFRGFKKRQKCFLRGRLRRLFLAETKQEYDKAHDCLMKILDVIPLSKEYWNRQWEPLVGNWSNVFRRFPRVRTTNFLESFHLFMKFAPMGANRVFVRRIGEAIRLLIQVDAHKTFVSLLKAVGRLSGNPNAEREMQRSGHRASLMLQKLNDCSHTTLEECTCTCRVLLEDREDLLYSVVHHDVMYDVSFRLMTCSCPAFEINSNAPCKHMMLVAQLHECENSHRHAFSTHDGRIELHSLKLLDELKQFFVDPVVRDIAQDVTDMTDGFVEWARLYKLDHPELRVPRPLELMGYQGNSTNVDMSPVASAEHSPSCDPTPHCNPSWNPISNPAGRSDCTGDDCQDPCTIESDGPPPVSPPVHASASSDSFSDQSGTQRKDNANGALLMASLRKCADHLRGISEILESVSRHGLLPAATHLEEQLSSMHQSLSRTVPLFLHEVSRNTTVYTNVSNRYGTRPSKSTDARERFLSIAMTRASKARRMDSAGTDIMDARLDTVENVQTRFRNAMRDDGQSPQRGYAKRARRAEQSEACSQPSQEARLSASSDWSILSLSQQPVSYPPWSVPSLSQPHISSVTIASVPPGLNHLNVGGAGGFVYTSQVPPGSWMPSGLYEQYFGVPIP